MYEFLHYENTIDVEIFQRVFQLKIIESDNLTFSFSENDEDYNELYKSNKMNFLKFYMKILKI